MFYVHRLEALSNFHEAVHAYASWYLFRAHLGHTMRRRISHPLSSRSDLYMSLKLVLGH